MTRKPVPAIVPGFSPRVGRIAASATAAMSALVAAKRKAGADVVSFTVGEPDFDTPEHVKEAAARALREGKTKYTPNAGIPELREAIAAAERRDAGIACAAKNVLVTPAKHGVLMSILATCDRGDEALIPDPAWVSYAPMVEWAHAKPVAVPLAGAEGFRMTPEAVAARITKKTRAIVVNSPSNPTGGVNTPADVKGILELAADHDLWVISDEIYQKLQFEGRHQSPAALPGGFERTLTVNGLSKSFAMTGWRMGWVVGPDAAMPELDKLQGQSISHVTSFAQYGALAAVTGPQDSVAAMKKEFHARRDLMVQGLRALPGVSCPVPQGAFYCFPRFDPEQWGGLGDEELTLKLLAEANVGATPGSAFGAAGKDHIRFSYATSRERIAEGLRRIAAWQRTQEVPQPKTIR
ncbi:MAG: pyridoxal phosphate-dependent aminotransferase [Thermoplasmatota archaeon]